MIVKSRKTQYVSFSQAKACLPIPMRQSTVVNFFLLEDP